MTAARLRKKAIDAVSVHADDEQEEMDRGVEAVIRTELEIAITGRKAGRGQQRLC